VYFAQLFHMAAPAIALYIDGGALFLFLFLGGQKKKI
jgi:hypothetical protein